MYACTSNEELGYCGAYGFNLGGWQGGQAEYMMVPWADFQLLKFPDRDQALEKIRDLTLLSDILPTGFHGCMEARVRPGFDRLYRRRRAGRPLRRSQRPSARRVLHHRRRQQQERLDLVKKAGYEVVDTSSETPVPDQIATILGQRWVDSGIDCVGLECHGYGPHGQPERGRSSHQHADGSGEAGGAIGIPGVYTDQDPGAPTPLNKEGKDGLGLPQGLGQVAIVHGRPMPGHALQPRSDDGDPLGPDAVSDPALEYRDHPARKGARGLQSLP